jgi:putative spermidine/putrescine transport system permease protein
MPRKLLPALFLVPAFTLFGAFFLLPVAYLFPWSLAGEKGAEVYLELLKNPRYLISLRDTTLLALIVTFFSLGAGTLSGLFLARREFPGKSLLLAALTLPLSFPGVVVGFMIILLAGRLGLLNSLSTLMFGQKLILAYSPVGLFLGYMYFSLPRVISTIMAAAGKLDPSLEEAARSLGSSPLKALIFITLPALSPALLSTGAICFATSVGAFGTAFTLATDLNVLPTIIYTEFTLSARISVAAALSLILGAVSFLALTLARLLTGLSGEGALA